MASKGTESRMRRWSNVELTEFATVLVDENESFLFQLETKAAKKASNMQIFANIKKNFDEHLDVEGVAEKVKEEIGERKFKDQPLIETTISKLRIKYKWMKNQRKIYNRRINSSGEKTALEKPEWLLILDPVLAQTNADLVRLGTVLVADQDENSEDEDQFTHNEDESMLDSCYDDLPSFCALRSKHPDTCTNMTDDEESGVVSSPESTSITNLRSANKAKKFKSTTDGNLEENAVNKSAKKPPMTGKEATSSVTATQIKSRKRKAEERSHEEALRDLTEGIQKMSETIDRRMALMIKEEKSRDESFLKFHERQCELNRQHELRMMEMMMRFAQPAPVSYSIPSGESGPIQAYYVNPRQGTSGENSSSEGRNTNEGK